jgi:ATP-binding cassette, subfamily B, multidrug efflux pump
MASDVGQKKAKGGMSSLLRLLPYAKPFKWHFLAVLILVIVFNATSVLQPYLVKVAIDRDIQPGHSNMHGLLTVSLLYVGVVFVSVAANYVQMLILQYAGQNVIRKIRIDLFAHIERQSMSFFDTNAIGRLVTNVSSDTETVSQFFTNFFLSMVRDGLSLVMIVVAMFELDIRIAAYSMILIPLLFGISLLFRKRLRLAYQATRTRLSNIIAFLAENLAGMRITQIFHQEDRQSRAFERLNRDHRTANVHEYQVSVMFNRFLELLGNVAVAAVVWVGGRGVIHGAIEFGTLYAFISYIRQFFQPINSITQQWNTLQSSMVAADRIGKILAVEPLVRDPAAPVEVEQKSVNGRVAFSNVTFGYKPGRPVLHDISFTVAPGSFVGFVGATGAGKSSIMSLLARFYDPTEGEITLDDMNIQSFRQTDLHKVIGLVQQDVNLFSGTVADNIRLFRKDIPKEDVVQAAKTVGVHEMIEKLPNGYETRLYGKGANLSMGERQLISFARIVALNPSVLILDEATANLDSQTEEWVQSGLTAVAANRTTLVIAHRLSTIRQADNIIVLDKGRIVEQGNHQSLLQQGGIYAELHDKSGIEYENDKMVHHTTV